MSNYPVGRRPRSADPQSALRLAAVTAVSAGVVLLAAAAFVLSYSGIHLVTLHAGVSPRLARLYPAIFDAMLIVAGAAAMALRGAGWWSRFYAWACLIVLLVAVATGDAAQATNTKFPEQASRAAAAITPWVLVLAAFGLLLAMLRHFRKSRVAVAARQEARAAAAAAGDAAAGDAAPWDAAGQPGEANGAATARTARSWAAAGAADVVAAAGERPLAMHRTTLDMLLGPRVGEEPAGATALSDPVSYGEQTGYVHPDSYRDDAYRDEGEYSPHGDSGGPGTYGDTWHDGEAGGDRAGTPAAAPQPSPGAATGSAATDTSKPADTATATDTGADTGEATDTAKTADAATIADAGGTADAGQATEADKNTETGQAAGAAPAVEARNGPDTDKRADPGKATGVGTAAEADRDPGADKNADNAKPADTAKATDTASTPDTGEAPDTAKAAEADKSADAGKAAETAKAIDTGNATDAGNGAQAGEQGGAAAEPQVVHAGAAPGGTAAQEPARVGADGATAATNGPALERIRSSPTRPEE